MIDKIKSLLSDDSLFYAVLILLVGITSFGLGRWSDAPSTAKQSGSVVMTATENVLPAATPETGQTSEMGQYVGSKNGSKYHLPSCPGAQQIKDENKVWFTSKTEAEARGYTPAANCKGI